MGCDIIWLCFALLHCHFYSHIPCGMWRIIHRISETFYRFLLTHPVWDVTIISQNPIHTAFNFYSHIPCGMWRFASTSSQTFDKFLLTHPVWDVTEMAARFPSFCSTFLLTHPVWDVTDIRTAGQQTVKAFLLTHPVWDVTWLYLGGDPKMGYFYSHIPCGMWRQRVLLLPIRM